MKDLNVMISCDRIDLYFELALHPFCKLTAGSGDAMMVFITIGTNFQVPGECYGKPPNPTWMTATGDFFTLGVSKNRGTPK